MTERVGAQLDPKPDERDKGQGVTSQMRGGICAHSVQATGCGTQEGHTCPA